MLKYEFKRLTSDRKNIYFLAFILFTALYFVDGSINEFKQHQEARNKKLKLDKDLVSNMSDYKQYSGYGFPVHLEPSPLSIYFNNSTLLSDLEGRIDNSELLKIYNQPEKKNLFYNKGFYRDFSGFLYFVGSFLMIYMGMVSIRSLNYVKFEIQLISLKRFIFLSTAPRFLYLNLFFITVMIISSSWVRLKGIVLSGEEMQHWILYSLFTIILLNFFYFVGLLVSIILKFKLSYFLWVFIVWLLIVFLSPIIIQLLIGDTSKQIPLKSSIDLEKVKAVQQFEQYAAKQFKATQNKINNREKFYRYTITQFLDNTQQLNKKLEDSLSNKIKENVSNYEKRSLLFPFLYYFFLSTEISGKGYGGYFGFKDHMLNTHSDFLKFFFNKYYIQKQLRVENFVKDKENIFKARSILPKTYWWSLLIMTLYCGLLVWASYTLLRRMVYRTD
jgi:hypothetical protein